MAGQDLIERLLSGVAARDPHRAFGVTAALSPSNLRRECRRNQALFHQDRGNALAVSQIANACADVMCDRVPVLSGEIVATAIDLLREIRQRTEQEQWAKLMQEWREGDKKARVDRVVTVENKRKAEVLLGTFERVPRSDASPAADVRAVFQRAFGVSNHEAGWLMKELGIRGIMNYKRLKVAIVDGIGLKIPAKTDGCTECPMCGYGWKTP